MKMRRKSEPAGTAEQHVREIRRATRKQYSAEEKIRIVLAGLRGEHSIAELCRREGIAESLYYSWSKEFLEAGKRRLDPPPLKWSALKYGFANPKEDHNAEEEAQAGRDRRQAAASRCAGSAR